MDFIIIPILALVGIVLGFFIGKNISDKTTKNIVDNANTEAKKIVSLAEKEGEARRKEIELESKSKIMRLESQANKEIDKRKKRANELERTAKQKENSLKQKVSNLTNKEKAFETKEKEVATIKENLKKQLSSIETKKSELDKKRNDLEVKASKLDEKLAEKLEKIAGLSADEAKEQLIETMTKKAETEAMALVKDIVDEAKMRANKEAKKIIIQTIQRTAAEHAIENAVSVFNLDSDDIKGQIIGREGRNIRALEAVTGVEIIVDDTPEAVVISGYDAFRREVARLSLQRLVADGRIHPARIEEVVQKTRRQLEQQIVEIGERTVIELDIHGLHPELIKLVGKMRYRSSYGQNLLQHSRETCNIAAIMASELGVNTKLAKRAGLLHDIGKVSDEDPELSHALLGMKLAERYKEKASICNAIGAHHDEIEMTYMISPIVQAADAISGSRPGARREILEQYLKRIKDLEELALAYNGVEKAYAIQAGRELRVIVESERVTDDKSEELSFEISQKIQSEMQYPGQIKVTVIREKRAVNFAK